MELLGYTGGNFGFAQMSDLMHALPDTINFFPNTTEQTIFDGSGNDESQILTDSNSSVTSYNTEEECTLFVGDIVKTLTEDQIKAIFVPYGDVVNVEIKKDKLTNASLGYAFVQFQTRLEASEAKRTLHRTVIANRAIRIGWAQKNTNLFVGDLDPLVTNEMLRDAFRVYGEIVEEETFAKKQNYGFVKFRRRIDAETAKKEMDGKVLGERRIRTGWGDANTQRHCVYIQFDPMSPTPLTESDIYSVFAAFGNVLNIYLPRSSPNRLKGFGFIRYNDTDEGEYSADTAIAALNNKYIAEVLIACNFGKKQHPKKRAGNVNLKDFSETTSEQQQSQPTSSSTNKNYPASTPTTEIRTGKKVPRSSRRPRFKQPTPQTTTAPPSTHTHSHTSTHSHQHPHLQQQQQQHSQHSPHQQHAVKSSPPQQLAPTVMPLMYSPAPTPGMWLPSQGWVGVPYIVSPAFYSQVHSRNHSIDTNNPHPLRQDDGNVYMYSYPPPSPAQYQPYSYYPPSGT